MKILVVLGTRPEIIRLAPTIKALKQVCDVRILFTGQNYAKNLSTDIFKDPLLLSAYTEYDCLNIGEQNSFFTQFGPMVEGIFKYALKHEFQKFLILGDTNTSLAAAIVARKMGIPIYHMEAGNRCYDYNSPEETNRLLIDSITDVHMCYTKFAKQNLLNEGVPQNRIHVIGNPMAEFSALHTRGERNHVLVTFHRQENMRYVSNIIQALEEVADSIKVICCLHPRAINNIYSKHPNIEIIPSVNFSKFIVLQRNSAVIVTDSGTVCEEACMLGVPSVIIRNTTERPELFDVGSTILCHPNNRYGMEQIIKMQIKADRPDGIPEEYEYQKVSEKVRNIVLGKGNYI